MPSKNHRLVRFLLPAVLALLLSASLPALLYAEDADKTLTITNRDAKPTEWGYRPADCATVALNPPSLTWVLESAAKSYTVQWAGDRTFTHPTTVRHVPWPTYTHHTPLAAGDYYWRYCFTTPNGQISRWSAVRRFTVPADAVAFPMPTRAEQRQRVPAAHPRLFLRPEDLPRFRKLARTHLANAFAELRAEADRIMAAGPTPEPRHLGSARDKDNAEAIKYWWPNRIQSEKACEEAQTLAFVYLISGERKYGEAARRWLIHLTSWDPDGPTNFNLNCEAAKVMLYRPARAYDWAYDALTPADRDRFRTVMLRRIQDAWRSGEVRGGIGHFNEPYNSHGNRIWHKIGEAGIAMLGEIPEAEIWLDYAFNKFYACYPVWSDDDGGWHEGVSYWNAYMSKAVWWQLAARSALGIDELAKPHFRRVGDFPLYVASPGSPNVGFGDRSDSPPGALGACLEYYVRAGKDRSGFERTGYWQWLCEQWHTKPAGGIRGFLFNANLPPPPPAKPPTNLPRSKVFHGVGVASLHTTLLNSRDDVHFLFKSSPFGSQSHGHNPQNSFQLNAYGEALLTTCVCRDLHGSAFHKGWAQNTVAHNAVLVDGQGQLQRTAAPLGRIAAEELTEGYDYVVGEAVAAYNGRLARFKRHVAFVKSSARPLIVIYDDLEAVTPSRFQFMLHGLGEFTLDPHAATLVLNRPNAGVRVRYLSPVPLAFRQWDGFEPKPTKDFPNQWHVEAGTRDRLTALEMLTVIVPYRVGSRPDCRMERLDSSGAVGVRMTIGRKPAGVAFRREGASGEVTWNGLKVTGPVLVY